MTRQSAPTPPPYEHSGDIQPGTLPPDLDAAYRGGFWAARHANGILASAVPAGGAYRNRAVVRANGKAKTNDLPSSSVSSHSDAPTPLIFSLNEWLRPIGYNVCQVADEIALSRGTHELVRLGEWTAATYHELALQHAGYVVATLYRTLTKAARLPSVVTTQEPDYRVLFARHWPAVAPALADVPVLDAAFQAALKLESLRALEYRQQRQRSLDAAKEAKTEPLRGTNNRRRGPGRPRLPGKKKDQRIYDAWNFRFPGGKRRYHTYEDFARDGAFSPMTAEELEKAVDRERKERAKQRRTDSE